MRPRRRTPLGRAQQEERNRHQHGAGALALGLLVRLALVGPVFRDGLGPRGRLVARFGPPARFLCESRTFRVHPDGTDGREGWFRALIRRMAQQ
jgi:hypothetical protein